MMVVKIRVREGAVQVPESKQRPKKVEGYEDERGGNYQHNDLIKLDLRLVHTTPGFPETALLTTPGGFPPGYGLGGLHSAPPLGSQLNPGRAE